MKHTKEKLEPIVAQNISIAGVLRDLGLRPSGGNYSHISRVIKKHGLDTSHFKGQGHYRGTKGKVANKKHWTEVLVKRERWQKRMPGARLTRALLESGREHVCEWCGIGPEWQGKQLTLEVDHINGDWSDNIPENVRFLCPNCHSQCETSSSNNKLGL